MRLAKYLAHAGVASRRAAEEIVRAGRVAVNGEVVTDPATPVGERARVTVGGKLVRPADETVVWALNKPHGVVSTAADTHRRPTVLDYVRSDVRLYPVGRLDMDVSGLILLTNDGALANRLTHPRYQVIKTYRARVANGPVSAPAVRALREGVLLDDGPTAPAQAWVLGPETIQLSIREGRKHQVKRMLAAVGHPVVGLERVRFGTLGLGSLRPGQARRLSPREVERLRGAASDPAGLSRP